jgi:beta-galactosidase
MKTRIARILLIGFIAAALQFGAALAASGRSQLIDRGWRFQRSDPSDAASVQFDDSSWRTLDLPHDWGIEGPFQAELPNNTGKLPWAGIAWYRKSLSFDASDRDRRIFLDFDGAMSHPEVFVNGRLAGKWAYGYTSFRIEITDLIQLDRPNQIAVRLENRPNSSRWYPGGGIYRHVWLTKTQRVHLDHWGVYVTTPQVDAGHAEVRVNSTVDNQSDQAAPVSVEYTLVAPGGGGEVGRGVSETTRAAAGGRVQCTAAMTVIRPALWSIESPRLYTLHTVVRVAGEVVDRMDTAVGIRSIEWNAAKGFLLNSTVVKLQGVCDHGDLGPLGTAVNARGLQRQLEILREMGCNAIRTSHNPPAPELLELCDQMGFLVLDEAFDCWAQAKTPNDYHLDFDAWHERDVINLVHRDRNHPSVIAWSCGNEIPEQKSAAAAELARGLVRLFHREDPSRLVTAACNNPAAGTNGFSEALDIMGFNYKPSFYRGFHERYPGKPYFGSETASTVSSRGEYYFPISWDKAKGFYDFQVSSYDLFAPGWAMRPDVEFAGQDQAQGVAGEFVWTGFDYLGEPTPYNADATDALNFSDPAQRQHALEMLAKQGNRAPSRSSYFGIIDLCGFKKDRFYLYQSRWRPDYPMAHLLPHWTWPDRQGQITPVHVYTSGDEGELFLNGRSLGRRKKGPFEYRLHWDDVKYEPGELKVVVYRRGVPWAEATERTTGPAAGLDLTADHTAVRADGSDLSYVTVRVIDSHGNEVPQAHPLVTFAITGPGEVAGVDNGDPTSWQPFQGRQMLAFNGRCLLIVRSQAGKPGRIHVTATTDGGATLTGQVSITAN